MAKTPLKNSFCVEKYDQNEFGKFFDLGHIFRKFVKMQAHFWVFVGLVKWFLFLVWFWSGHLIGQKMSLAPAQGSISANSFLAHPEIAQKMRKKSAQKNAILWAVKGGQLWFLQKSSTNYYGAFSQNFLTAQRGAAFLALFFAFFGASWWAQRNSQKFSPGAAGRSFSGSPGPRQAPKTFSVIWGSALFGGKNWIFHGVNFFVNFFKIWKSQNLHIFWR